MQGRAALLASFVALACYSSVRLMNSKHMAFASCTIVPLLIVGIILFWQELYTYFSSALFLDDEYRGVGTGFVGREDVWNDAWNYFLKSPIIGNGAGFFNHLDNVYPHNFFLLGLSEFGLLSLPIFGIMFALMFAMFRNDLEKYSSLASIPIFWMFNARFININPYPFLFFVVLLAYANSSTWTPPNTLSDRGVNDSIGCVRKRRRAVT
jgi:O-antigen ligase